MNEATSVDELTGRELDAAVAEEVMGWSDVNGDEQHFMAPARRPSFGVTSVPPPLTGVALHGSRVRVPHYSTDIAAAWEVVERIGELGYGVVANTTGKVGEGQWRVAFMGLDFQFFDEVHMPDPDKWAWADTFPLAVCEAALKAVRAGREMKGGEE